MNAVAFVSLPTLAAPVASALTPLDRESDTSTSSESLYSEGSNKDMAADMPARNEHSPAPSFFGLHKLKRDEMDNETQAEVRRYLTRAAIQLLSAQATEENYDERTEWFCHILMGMFVQRYQNSTRLDHIIRSINTDRAQHPKLREIAEQINAVFTEFSDDLIVALTSHLKNPEASPFDLPIRPELAAKIAEKRAASFQPTTGRKKRKPEEPS